MTVIYLDELFLLNFVVDYLLLLAAGRLAGEILRRGRLALGAALGAAYAGAVFLPGLGFLAHPLCKLGAAVLIWRLARLESFGVAYLTPFSAGGQSGLDGVLRLPLPWVKLRQSGLNTRNRRNQA